MQLKKRNWKRIRGSAAYTQPTPEGFRCRRGRFKTFEQHSQQLSSRTKNPLDPINSGRANQQTNN